MIPISRQTYLRGIAESIESYNLETERLAQKISFWEGLNLAASYLKETCKSSNEINSLKIEEEKLEKDLSEAVIKKIEDLEIYKLGNPYSEFQKLPINRGVKKDTKKYMALMLGKLEFVKKAIDINPFNSNYFFWFDFSIAYIFKNKDKTLLKIKEISNLNFKDNFICIPGCWDFKIKIGDLKNHIVWRFCGGLLFGDKESLIDFYQKSNDHFLSFLEQNKMLLWEVNYWAWLESFNLISPIWYLAGHDDSMFMNIPNF
jgi:hypothetical protein